MRVISLVHVHLTRTDQWQILNFYIQRFFKPVVGIKDTPLLFLNMMPLIVHREHTYMAISTSDLYPTISALQRRTQHSMLVNQYVL